MADPQELVGEALDAVFGSLQAGPDRGAELEAAVQRLDGLRQRHGDELPPMLAHYLEKRSYAKAREFLAGRERPAKPRCA